MEQYLMRGGIWHHTTMLVCVMLQLPAIYAGYMWAALAGGLILGMWIATYFYEGLVDSYHDMVQRSLNAYKVYLDEV